MENMINFNMQDAKKRNNKWECEVCHKKMSTMEVIVEEMITCKNPDCIKDARKQSWFEGDK